MKCGPWCMYIFNPVLYFVYPFSILGRFFVPLKIMKKKNGCLTVNSPTQALCTVLCIYVCVHMNGMKYMVKNSVYTKMGWNTQQKSRFCVHIIFYCVFHPVLCVHIFFQCVFHPVSMYTYIDTQNDWVGELAVSAIFLDSCKVGSFTRLLGVQKWAIIALTVEGEWALFDVCAWPNPWIGLQYAYTDGLPIIHLHT